jgi:hypothetical protein
MDNTIFAAEKLKPALLSIRDACTYMGGVSRAKFYADILPKLETVHLGARHFIVARSIDELITKRANPVRGRNHRCTKRRRRNEP